MVSDSTRNPHKRAIVVTGAASGIGLATMRALRQPDSVTIGIDLADTPIEFTEASDVAWIRGDVAQEDTWNRAQATLLRLRPEGAEGLVACAAELVAASFLATPLEQWRRLFEVNVLGVVRALQTFLPAMIERRHGAVAVVCSVNSLYVEDKLSAYSTSKAALLHIVRSAALEYARHGVRINAVCPGVIDTPLLRRHLESLPDPNGARRAAEKRTPTGAILQPEEIAAVIRFLLTDDATGLSGAAVIVDGGLTSAYDFDSEAP